MRSASANPLRSHATSSGRTTEAESFPTCAECRSLDRTSYCIRALLAERERRIQRAARRLVRNTLASQSILRAARGCAGRGYWHCVRVARNRTPCETLRGPEVWKRQPKESVIAYASFRAFRDLQPGERSIARVCRDLKKNETMLQDRARRWRWLERVDQFDAHMEELALKSQEDAFAAMNDRHAGLALVGLRKVLQRLNGDDVEGVQGIDASRLTPQDCSRLVEVLSKLERLARGAESERIETNSGAPTRILLGFDAQPDFLNPEQALGHVSHETPRELDPPSSN
jgi:hypothetical protein